MDKSWLQNNWFKLSLILTLLILGAGYFINESKKQKVIERTIMAELKQESEQEKKDLETQLYLQYRAECRKIEENNLDSARRILENCSSEECKNVASQISVGETFIKACIENKFK